MQIYIFALVIYKWCKLILTCVIFISTDVNQITINIINKHEGCSSHNFMKKISYEF